MKLDKDWVKTIMKCPQCNNELLYDENENKDATHYCKKCKMGLLIILNVRLRGEE